MPVTAPEGAPNIVLVLLDDVGFAATSTFGGATPTPSLDRLAAGGLRYNRFHVNPMCSPTRAALLSGRNSHQVGFGRISELASAHPGYNSVWPKASAGIADVLRRNGYSTGRCDRVGPAARRDRTREAVLLTPAGGPARPTGFRWSRPMVARLFVDGSGAGESTLVLAHNFATLDVGGDLASPVSPRYAWPFAFTGRIESVAIDLLEDR